MKKSAPHPRSRKTPTGGKKMAKMILKISLFQGALEPMLKRYCRLHHKERCGVYCIYLPVKGMIAV